MNRALLALVLLLAVPACTPPGATVPQPEPEAKFVAVLALRPVRVALAPGATVGFQAEINYPEGIQYLRQPVRWRVVEPQGGTIDGLGLYTAPRAPGTYHVEAQREDFPDLKATATVVVK